MDKKRSESIHDIARQLSGNAITQYSAFLGFDACIDNIVKVVKEKDAAGLQVFFNDSDEFGRFLAGLDNRSCGVELQTMLSKTGGNMVIQANALGNLGVKVDCAGTFGFPEILPVFHSMSENCTLHTIADTISATALEFNSSKVIMFDPGPYNHLTWDGIKEVLGLPRIREFVSRKQLLAFVNWSEIENSSQIWKGFLDDVFPSIDRSELPSIYFTDFSDCSRKTGFEIRSALDLLGQLRDYFRVILSLNQNEAGLVAGAAGIEVQADDREFISELYEHTGSDILVIHRIKDAIAFDGMEFEECATFMCSEPKILTGGGDNFNAGFCFAQLNGMDLYKSTLLANAVSGYYVKTGLSPSVTELVNFLEQM